jgi:hypothetical protein
LLFPSSLPLAEANGSREVSWALAQYTAIFGLKPDLPFDIFRWLKPTAMIFAGVIDFYNHL